MDKFPGHRRRSRHNGEQLLPLVSAFRRTAHKLHRPPLAFWDIKLGASLNYLEHNHQQTGIYGFTGAGFNLARSSKFASFILLGYTFRQRRKVVGHEMAHDFHDLHYATVKIGVSF